MMNPSNSRISITRLILIPSVITLFVTLLRLVGELQNWPRALFNRDAGGGGSIVGITWLALVFGAYFALKLMSAGETPLAQVSDRLCVVGVGGDIRWRNSRIWHKGGVPEPPYRSGSDMRVIDSLYGWKTL